MDDINMIDWYNQQDDAMMNEGSTDNPATVIAPVVSEPAQTFNFSPENLDYLRNAGVSDDELQRLDLVQRRASEYNPDKGGALENIFKKTITQPQPLDEQQLNRLRNQAAITDALGLLVQIGGGFAGANNRVRGVNETASAQGAAQERNIREIYRKLNNDYESGLMKARMGDYEEDYKNTLAVRKRIEALLDTKLKNEASVALEGVRTKNRREEADIRHKNTLEVNSERAESQRELAEFNQKMNNARTEYTQAQINERSDANRKDRATQNATRNVISQQNAERAGTYSRNATTAENRLINSIQARNEKNLPSGTPPSGITDPQQNMNSFKAELMQMFPHAVFSSEYRPGATTKVTGEPSRHASIGGAIDIAPSSDKDGKIRAFLNSNEGKLLLYKYGFGFLDETLKGNEKHGNSYHIGQDTTLVNPNRRYVEQNFPQVKSKPSATRQPAAPKNKKVSIPVNEGIEGSEYLEGVGNFVTKEFTPEQYSAIASKAKQEIKAMGDKEFERNFQMKMPSLTGLKDDDYIRLYSQMHPEFINPQIAIQKREDVDVFVTQKMRDRSRGIMPNENDAIASDMESLNSLPDDQVAEMASLDSDFAAPLGLLPKSNETKTKHRLRIMRDKKTIAEAYRQWYANQDDEDMSDLLEYEVNQ